VQPRLKNLRKSQSVRYVRSIVVVPEFIWDLVLSRVGHLGPGFVQFSPRSLGSKQHAGGLFYFLTARAETRRL
jgi:hypothetical protein